MSRIVNSLLCLVTFVFVNTCSQTIGSAVADIHEKFNLKVSSDSFTEFSDSLSIEEENKFLELSKIYLKKIDLNKFTIRENELLTYKQILEIKKEMLRDAANEKSERIFKQNFVNTKKIYNINLNEQRTSQSGQNEVHSNSNTVSSENNTNSLMENAKDNPWLYAEAATLFEKTGKYSEAINLYEKAVIAYPARIELLYSYALCLYKCSKYTKSEDIFNKILMINSEFTLAHYNLGNIYFKTSDFNKALKSFANAYRLNPYSSDTCFNIALTLECLNEKSLAEKYYLKCIQLNPDDFQAKQAVKRLSNA